MTINHERNETIFTGSVVDQAAIHGLLNLIRDLNLILLSVGLMESSGGIR